MTSQDLNRIRIVVIDDDPVNNLICRIAFKLALDKTDVLCFTDPAEGFQYVKNSCEAERDFDSLVLFLDVNMPSVTGWEMLDSFAVMSEDARRVIKIFMLSSSVDTRDRLRATGYRAVSDYLVKPLTAETIGALFFTRPV
jgi:two-component system chemotaxis response regulator CheY